MGTIAPHDNYGIRHDYVARDMAVTVPQNTTADYWTPYRIRMSHSYQYAVYRRARDLVRQHGLASVLDVGCGPASKLQTLLAPICDDIVGIDEPGVIEWCRSHRSKGRFLACDIEHEPPSLARTFDLVICADVIEHLSNPDRLLAMVRAVAHEGTWIVISTPDRDRLRGPDCLKSPKADHVREWNVQELARYLESRGFAIHEHRLVLPMRIGLSRESLRYVRTQWRAKRSLASCQLLVCKIR